MPKIVHGVGFLCAAVLVIISVSLASDEERKPEYDDNKFCDVWN